MRLLPIMGISGELNKPLALQIIQPGPNFIAEKAIAIRPGDDGELSAFYRMSLSVAQPEHFFKPIVRVSVVDGHGPDDCQMPNTLRFFGYTPSDDLIKRRHMGGGIPVCMTVTLQPGEDPRVRTFNSSPVPLMRDINNIDPSRHTATTEARFRGHLRRLLNLETSMARIEEKPLTFGDIQQIATRGPVSQANIQDLMEPMILATELSSGIPKLSVGEAVRVMCREIRQFAAGK